jgi:bis(5'-nucleosyl)-tetraphosphatase (symmetrical)
MSTYVIGDVQGCYDELIELLDKINFNRQNDKLIFAGDIINKGSKSLETINFIMSLKESAQLVLGNHELLFLAISYGYKANKSNSLQEILNSNRLHEIQEWISNQKMLININDCYITHAGIPHTWSQKKAKGRALELESVISNINTRELFLKRLFYTKNNLWNKNIKLPYRWISSANYLTRMRLINKHGKLNLKYSSDLNNLPKNWKPWFSFRNKSFKNKKIIFGHWAALNGITLNSNVIALDTGCVYGGKLTCYCIDNQQIYYVKAKMNKDI